MRLQIVALIVAIFSLVSYAVPEARRVSTVGSFSLDQADPRAGSEISFTVDVQNLPTNGGATISPWVELTCGSVYEAVDAAISPVVSGTSNPTRVFFTLVSPEWSAAGFSTQSCEAHLFYDGWNGPRRRKTNTLASLFFTVTAP